ncbi:hypothetical protein ACFQPF_03205 [Fictibacillus iocasae]|uniref:Uncharacterized protein n=1 Tax=Fictibacillus iocasae TaxID=2715437 RepID=A0ABW2NMZ7_9BACL
MQKTECRDKVQIIHDYLNSLDVVNGQHVAGILQEVLSIDIYRISSSGEGKKAASYPAEVMNCVQKALLMDGRDSSAEYIMALEKAEVLDLYLIQQEECSAKDALRAINMIFGMNVEGIATLETARISLFSKGQWISRTGRDLAAVFTGKGDVDVEIRPTTYFKEITGHSELPDLLQDELKQLGFSYDKSRNGFYYSNPAGVSVPDEFKMKTMSTITKGLEEFRT